MASLSLVALKKSDTVAISSFLNFAGVIFCSYHRQKGSTEARRAAYRTSEASTIVLTQRRHTNALHHLHNALQIYVTTPVKYTQQEGVSFDLTEVSST